MHRVLDLFAGAGGFSKGFTDAGFQVVTAVENFPPAAETYRHNFPGTRVIVEDVKRVDAKDVGAVDVIIGGPPCEPYTVTNVKRRKEPLERLYDDPAGRLVLHFIRFVGDIQPEAFVMENVMGLIEGDLKEALRYEFGRVGYEVKFNVLKAEEYGVPSVRTRVFVSNVRIRPKRGRKRTVWDAIRDMPDPREDSSVPNHVYRAMPARVEREVHRLRWGQAPVYYKGAKGTYRNYIRLHPNRPAPTVMGSSRFIHPFANRLLTVREHARLMSYPDTFIFFGSSDQQYNQVGESVPPLLSRKIAEELLRKIG